MEKNITLQQRIRRRSHSAAQLRQRSAQRLEEAHRESAPHAARPDSARRCGVGCRRGNARGDRPHKHPQRQLPRHAPRARPAHRAPRSHHRRRQPLHSLPRPAPHNDSERRRQVSVDSRSEHPRQDIPRRIHGHLSIRIVVDV